MVALDLSRAFDCVNHDLLLADILESALPSAAKKWVAAYLRDRQTYVEFRNHKSTHRKVHQGVPQGGVLSPLLFNFYLATLPDPPNGVKTVSYADDCSVMTSGTDVNEMCNRMNGYLATLHAWFSGRNLQLSPTKSSAMLFTTHTAQCDIALNVQINGVVIPTSKKTKVLGVIFDNMFTFAAHAESTRDKVKKRNNVLKSLAGTSWGMDKECLLLTYKAISRAIINYAAPIWTPGISDTWWKMLQVAQNDALRTATGCHKMAAIDHLHTETKVLSVEAHNRMLCRQYLLSCHQQDHPCNAIVSAPRPPRLLKKDLRSEFEPAVLPLIPANGLDRVSYRRGLGILHRQAVEDGVRGYRPNVVLGGYPPPIAAEEESLPRKARTALSQLRSGWCRQLNSYRARIDPVNYRDICPDCGVGPHDPAHLFRCAAKPTTPTTLNVEDLWRRPVMVANFLGLRDD